LSHAFGAVLIIQIDLSVGGRRSRNGSLGYSMALQQIPESDYRCAMYFRSHLNGYKIDAKPHDSCPDRYKLETAFSRLWMEPYSSRR